MVFCKIFLEHLESLLFAGGFPLLAASHTMEREQGADA